MNILDKIVGVKMKEVEQLKSTITYRTMESSPYFHREVLSMRNSLLHQGSSGIIAEFKRKSPSKGVINDKSKIEDVVTDYAKAAAAGISVLTDQSFFGGSVNDLTVARNLVNIPLLRKEFIIDEFQIVESKAQGADLILLIAAILDSFQVGQMTTLAHSLGMEVLLEVHNEQELQFNEDAGVDMIGVNNRDLKTFQVSMETSRRLFPMINPAVVPVSESGIEHLDSIRDLKVVGYKGFLVGQRFMETESPGEAAHIFIRKASTGINEV